MTVDACKAELSKAEVDKFLFGKHITACPVCGRFRSQCDVDVHKLTCQRASGSEASPGAPVDVIMVVCQNCGAIQFHDRTVISKWLNCQQKSLVR